MKKVLTIEGMSCAHCQARVEKALEAIENVESAKVDLKKKTATVSLAGPVEDKTLLQAVSAAGYEPVSIAEKKGLFN